MSPIDQLWPWLSAFVIWQVAVGLALRREWRPKPLGSPTVLPNPQAEGVAAGTG
jgi:hypothetical protein